MHTDYLSLGIDKGPAADPAEVFTDIGDTPHLAPGYDWFVCIVSAAGKHSATSKDTGMDIARIALGETEGIAVFADANLRLDNGHRGCAAACPQHADIGVSLLFDAAYAHQAPVCFLQPDDIAAVGDMAGGYPNA